MARQPKPNGRKPGTRITTYRVAKKRALDGGCTIRKAGGSHRIVEGDGFSITTYDDNGKDYPPGTAALLTRLYRKYGLIVLLVSLVAGLMEVLR